MYLGIDVGGTFTDGVLINNNNVLKSCKFPTDNTNLLRSIVEILDYLIDNNTKDKLKRIVVSTTLMTNLILEKKYAPTGLLLMPGPGVNINDYQFPFPCSIVQGGVDFQGRIIQEIDEHEIIESITRLDGLGIKNLGIISKFSSRNPDLEVRAEKIVKQYFPLLNIKTGHQISGNLNFLRRAMSTGLFLASQRTFEQFICSIKDAFTRRGFTCPSYILKADGGVISLDSAHKFAVDTILSGPAASCFGALSLLEANSSALVMDIGGTTTDLSLILDSIPLFAAKGVKIADLYTHVRSLAVHSIPIGGDTEVQVEGNDLVLTFQRQGSPACLGGQNPTITDCLRVLELTDIGDREQAVNSLEPLARQLNISYQGVAQKTLDKVITLIEEAVTHVFESWQEEPAYRIWQLLNPRNIKPEVIVSLGGPGGPIGSLLSKKLQMKHINYPLSSVANAIGAALSVPTFEGMIRINTEKREISTSWGYFSSTNQSIKQKISKERAGTLALELFQEYLLKTDFNIQAKPVIVQHEIFNMVRDWHTTGQIHEIILAIPPRILGLIENKGCSLNE